jgi:heme oxygenase
MWASFVGILNEHGASPEFDQAQAVSSACGTFKAIEEWLGS